MKTIPLTQGLVAIVDDADYEKVCGTKWTATKSRRRFYAVRAVQADGKQTNILLHRFLTNCPPDMEVNHTNGDGLNCKQDNMQVCTHQQNTFAFRRKSANASSKYRGVSWYSRDNCWCANIRPHGKAFYLGSFDSEESAARAYDVAARKYFGEYAQLNFP